MEQVTMITGIICGLIFLAAIHYVAWIIARYVEDKLKK